MAFDIRAPKNNHRLDSQHFKEVVELLKALPWLDDVLEGFIELNNYCENESEINLIIDLLKKFNYINAKELRSYLTDLVRYITNIENVLPSNTIIFAFGDARRPDGSHAILQQMKNLLPLTHSEGEFEINLNLNCVNGIQGKIENIFLIDDFIGTGDTARRKIEYVQKVLKKKERVDIKVHVISVAAMVDARVVLDSLGVEYYSSLWICKGISGYEESIINIHDAKQIMLDLENRLEQNHSGKSLPSFGYKKSEALFSIENMNTPNNVFPIFWWPYLITGKTRQTMFQRACR